MASIIQVRKLLTSPEGIPGHLNGKIMGNSRKNPWTLGQLSMGPSESRFRSFHAADDTGTYVEHHRKTLVMADIEKCVFFFFFDGP